MPDERQIKVSRNKSTKMKQSICSLNAQYDRNKALEYKELSQKYQIKCKFLIQKLAAYQNGGGVAEQIQLEACSIYKKIKELEAQQQIRRGREMELFRGKMSHFLDCINFSIAYSHLQKIKTLPELFYFTIEAALQKFRQLLQQRAEVDFILKHLGEEIEPQMSQVAYYEGIKHYKKELESQFVGSDRRTQRLSPLVVKNWSKFEDSFGAEGKSQLELEVRLLRQKVSELEILLRQIQADRRMLQIELQRIKKEQIKWKQRYSSMECQKEQRIQLLQKQLAGQKSTAHNQGEGWSSQRLFGAKEKRTD